MAKIEEELPRGHHDAHEVGIVLVSRSRMRSLAMSLVVSGVLASTACRTQPLDPGGGGTAGGGTAGGGGVGGGGVGGGGDASPDLAPGGGGGGFPDFGLWPDGSASDGFVKGGPDLGPIPPAPIPCGRTGSDPGTADPFKRAQYGVVANWRGYATSPWALAPSWTVEIDFTSSSYFARTLDSSAAGWAVPPFYYDSNPESDSYHLTNLDSDGTISGQLYLSFSTTPDTISGLTLNSDLTHLHFEFYNGTAGPVVYELDCY